MTVYTLHKKKGLSRSHWSCWTVTVCFCGGECVSQKNDLAWHDTIHILAMVYITMHRYIVTALVFQQWIDSDRILQVDIGVLNSARVGDTLLEY